MDENIKALELYRKWTPELEQRLETLLSNGPAPEINMRLFMPNKSRRHQAVFERPLL